ESLPDLEQAAKDRVRAMKPDLVVLMIPASEELDDFEASVHAISWLMNWSLSFGHQEWDCIVVHPSVVDPMTDPARGALIRRLVHAQHLDLIDRQSGDTSDPDAIVRTWFASRLRP
ncbi:MAG: lysophospholipase, partial [Planctomycetota bacterium]|nr:lysophospholipase [Planctomycetota bacterium]